MTIIELYTRLLQAAQDRGTNLERRVEHIAQRIILTEFPDQLTCIHCNMPLNLGNPMGSWMLLVDRLAQYELLRQGSITQGFSLTNIHTSYSANMTKEQARQTIDRVTNSLKTALPSLRDLAESAGLAEHLPHEPDSLYLYSEHDQHPDKCRVCRSNLRGRVNRLLTKHSAIQTVKIVENTYHVIFSERGMQYHQKWLFKENEI